MKDFSKLNSTVFERERGGGLNGIIQFNGKLFQSMHELCSRRKGKN